MSGFLGGAMLSKQVMDEKADVRALRPSQGFLVASTPQGKGTSYSILNPDDF